MCGIVGAIAERNVTPILIEGLQRLEYRGYDSAGVAVLDPASSELQTICMLGKVAQLAATVQAKAVVSTLGIAHTRWATHGAPSKRNAHPHTSGDEIAIVHNGIIENHVDLKQQLTAQGYQFVSETDSEVVAHLIHSHRAQGMDLPQAIYQAGQILQGAFALAIICKQHPDTLYAFKQGSPLVIGLGIGENFVASDPLALWPVTQRFIYLEEGDMVILTRERVAVFDAHYQPVTRAEKQPDLKLEDTTKGEFRHFMQKEMYDQPQALLNSFKMQCSEQLCEVSCFGAQAKEIFARVKRVKIIACGTSFHAGLVARHWIESISGLPTQVEVASENRYRQQVVEEDCLLVALSQSGETADTLAALRRAQASGYLATLGITNVAESTLMREADLVFLMQAGSEIGVAATKTFMNQLSALLQLAIALCQQVATKHVALLNDLHNLPSVLQDLLGLDVAIASLAKRFADKQHALFLGRDITYPIALEGALKLKEISYIHAEAYPAGELKHGPLALVDEHMPVVVLAPNDLLVDKLSSNIKEVQARGGQLIVFADQSLNWPSSDDCIIIPMPTTNYYLVPFVYTLPMQLLAYHVAVLKGTDVDQPRNLAKSVTVE